jgi:hypothetical protein
MGNHLLDSLRTVSEQTLTILKSDRSGVEIELSYGTRSIAPPDAPADSVDCSALKGHRVGFHLSRTGDLSGYRGYADLPAIQIPAMGEELDERRYKIETRFWFPHLPDRPVRVGDRWTARDTHKDRRGGSTVDVVLDHEYTLLGPVPDSPGGLVRIDDAYTVTIEGTIDAGGLLLDLTMLGKGTDRWIFSTRHGMVASQQGTLQIEGTAANAELGIRAPIRNDYASSLTLTMLDR